MCSKDIIKESNKDLDCVVDSYNNFLKKCEEYKQLDSNSKLFKKTCPRCM